MTFVSQADANSITLPPETPKRTEMKQLIPIFFSVNDAYAPYLATAIYSIRENASKNYDYLIHVLTDDISEENRSKLKSLEAEGFGIEFFPLSEKMRSLPSVGLLEQHCFGAFASLTIYFRLFIPELFPQYKKAIYLDADLVVPGDISRLWEEPLGNKLIGAVADYGIQHIAPFMRYIDEYVGVDHRNYINSGVLLMNLDRLREVRLSGRFLSWMSKYHFKTVAPDQDYLNALCWNAIHYLDPNWDAMPGERFTSFENPQIIHYNLAAKPWLNESVPYGDVFWHYAQSSGYYDEITTRHENFIRDPKALANYQSGVDKLIRLAAKLTKERNSFRTIISKGKELRLCS